MRESMVELLARLGRHWRAQGIEPLPGVSADAVLRFEAQAGVRLPADVRTYFETFNGFADSAMDRELISFWPLARVRSVVAELNHQEAVVPDGRALYCFADYSIWCNAYAVRLSDATQAVTDVVAVYSGVDLIPAAGTFADFLRAYIGPTPDSVLHPRWEKDGKQYGAAI